jgi:hypothetical protein
MVFERKIFRRGFIQTSNNATVHVRNRHSFRRSASFLRSRKRSRREYQMDSLERRRSLRTKLFDESDWRNRGTIT